MSPVAACKDCCCAPVERFLALKSEALTMRRRHIQVNENTDSVADFQFSERFLQIVWNEQRLVENLHTTDGRRLEILSPGTWNVEGGPDFRNAVVRFDGEARTGDVEIHRTTADWWRHGHDADPAYRRVVLHAVWRDTEAQNRPGLPCCLVLADALDRPCRVLTQELQAEIYPYARQVAPGSCALKWALTEDERLLHVLEVAAEARFEEKTARLQKAAIAVGWEQALYECLFEALGYKANREPFRQLAHAVPLQYLQDLGDTGRREAALYGNAGLLPDPSVVKVDRFWHDHLRMLWHAWWPQRREPLKLHWCRSGTRPCNSPERRLAAGIRLLEKSRLALGKDMEKAVQAAQTPRELLRNVQRQLCVHSSWNGFVNFATKLNRPSRLLGQQRTNDMIVNVILPFLHALARRRGDAKGAQLARDAYRLVPALQANRRLTEAVHRFLIPPSRGHALLRHACHQQGLLEIHRSFCTVLSNDCKNCPFVVAFPVEHS